MYSSTDLVMRAAVYIILLLASAIQMAYRNAAVRLIESDLAGEDGAQTVSDEALRKIRESMDDPSGLTRSVWFWLILASSAGIAAASDVIPAGRAASVLILAAPVYLLGAAVPAVLAGMDPLRTAVRLCGISGILTTISWPFTAVLWLLAGLPARAAGVDPESLEERIGEDEILSMVNEGHEQGAIDTDEAQMITNIFQLDDKQAQDIMTHRGDISAIDADTTLDEAIAFMTEATNSRFPVYKDSIDHIIGALYLKDALAFHMKGRFGAMPVGSVPHLLREVKFIPETIGLDDLFREMQESRKQMAIVVDEYGETSGLVTMEDILEEIVGNILDEYDKEEKLIVRTGEGRFRINGKALLEDVSDALGRTISTEDYDTLSGYLTERLGHIPTGEDRGTVIEDRHLGYRFRILGTSGTMIGWTEATAAPDLTDGPHTDNS